MTGKSKLVLFKSSLESIEKLSAEDNTEYLDGQKELVSTGNPTPLIGREPSTRDDAMQMGMMQERSPPSMQDRQKPDLSAEMFGSAAIWSRVSAAVRKSRP